MKYTNRGEIVIEQRKLVNKLTKKGYPIVRIRQNWRNKYKTEYLFKSTPELREELMDIARAEVEELKKKMFA